MGPVVGMVPSCLDLPDGRCRSGLGRRAVMFSGGYGSFRYRSVGELY